VSAALLANGDVVVGNTGDNNMLEFTPSGGLVATKNVDSGSAGAIFGIVATGRRRQTRRSISTTTTRNAVVLISQ